MLDAVCRHHQHPLWKLVQDNRLGIDLRSLSPELAGVRPQDFIRDRPLDSVTLRHTVGMADPLRENDIPETERLDDGLPQSLEACIHQYCLREFKLKLSGQASADLHRLRAIASVVIDTVPANFLFSLDSNEKFATPEQLRTFGEQVYAGISHKNCKGVFKDLRNRALIAWHQQQHPQQTFLMTAEDLANIGPVALLQDLAVQALLGNASVERNGHHYFKGLSVFPSQISDDILENHPDLYHPGRDGHAYLTVAEGRISLKTVNHTAFGAAES